MPDGRLLSALELQGARCDRRFAWRLIAAVLAIYTAGFLVWFPLGPTNDDEAAYLRQARMVLMGSTTVAVVNPLLGKTVDYRPSRYPVGTALLMAPFVWIGGWRGAYLVPLLCLGVAVLATARWIQEEGCSPLFALVLLSFPVALVMARVATSDVPSAAVVAVGLWMFWRGIDRPWPYWAAAGLLAGLSILLRESNALLFAPFFAGTLLRREGKCIALVAGGLLGVGARLLLSSIVYDDPFFYKTPSSFALASVARTLPLYGLGLLVFVPGGLIAALAYRGRRRPELVIACLGFSAFYCSYGYAGSESGAVKGLVLVLRFMIPLLPLLALALAETVPRAARWAVSRCPGRRRRRLELSMAAAATLWIAGTASAAGAVHVAYAHWSASLAEIRDAIDEHVSPDSVIVSNGLATKKFIRKIDRDYLPVHRMNVTPAVATRLVEQYGEFSIVLLDRSDSEFWRRDARANAAFIETLSPTPRLELDLWATPTHRLRIWRVTKVSAEAEEVQTGGPPETRARYTAPSPSSR